MFTYALMGVPFIGAVILLDVFILRTRIIFTKQFWVVLAIMIFLTAIFDQFLTGLPIVFYNDAHMIGFRLGYAPLEDFTYTAAAVIGVGSMLKYVQK